MSIKLYELDIKFHENGKGLARGDINSDGFVDLIATNSNGYIFGENDEGIMKGGPIFLWINQENENKEKRGEKSKTHKQRKKNEESGYTPEAREEEEEEGLVFLPVSLELDNLRDWAVPGSEGDKGALVDVNNRKVL